MSAAQLFVVRVLLDTAGRRSDAYFDLTNVDADSPDQAIGYATRLSTECFGLPLERLRISVLSSQSIIDC